MLCFLSSFVKEVTFNIMIWRVTSRPNEKKTLMFQLRDKTSAQTDFVLHGGVQQG